MESFLEIIGGWIYLILFFGVLFIVYSLGDIRHKLDLVSSYIHEIREQQRWIQSHIEEMNERDKSNKD